MITHKVVAMHALDGSIPSDRGAWEDFNSANRQAIEIAENMKRGGSVEVHELISGTGTTKNIVVRYCVELEKKAHGVVELVTRTIRTEIGY